MAIFLAFLACLIPSLALFFWLKSIRKDKPGYAAGCRRALLCGIFTAVPVFLTQFVLNLIGSDLLKLNERSEILWAFYSTFVLYALAEEVWKFLSFKHVLRKTKCDCSWYDVTVFMTLVGGGFEILESFVYAFTMSPVQAIIRGVTMLHAVFGFILGYFYGKSLRTGKKRYLAIGFLLAYLFHAVYDLSLSPVFDDIFVFSFIAVNLDLTGLAMLIVMIVFFARRKHNELYTSPFHAARTPIEPAQEACAADLPDAAETDLPADRE